MRYIAALDYDHLDNGVFLTSFAKSLARQQHKQNIRPIIIHSDSDYTERIIQTGVMRDEATVRSMKDLNNRLVALFADQGVSTIGINPFHRSFITMQDNNLQIDRSFFKALPDKPVLLLSTLVKDAAAKHPVNISLSRLMNFLIDSLDADECFTFSKSDEAEVLTSIGDNSDHLKWKNIEPAYLKKHIPEEFYDFDAPVRLTTSRDFCQIPDLSKTILID